MLDFKLFNDIRKNAKSSIKSDNEGNSIEGIIDKSIFILGFYLLPLAIVIWAIYKDVNLTNLETYIGASIAIFTGLFFSLILSIGSKVRAEEANPNKENESFQKFKENMKQIANITLYVIVHGVVIFLIMLLNSVFKNPGYPIIEQIFTSLALFLLVRYTISLFFMLQRFTHVIKDEIENIL